MYLSKSVIWLQKNAAVQTIQERICNAGVANSLNASCQACVYLQPQVVAVAEKA